METKKTLIEIRKNKDIVPLAFDNCHDGEGVLMCKDLLSGLESEDYSYMHSDYMAAGVSIGKHEHVQNEEIYYLSSGRGTLYYDDKEFEMKTGDISLCKRGHSHGFLALDDCILIVVARR